jgi:hypothetical protein
MAILTEVPPNIAQGQPVNPQHFIDTIETAIDAKNRAAMAYNLRGTQVYNEGFLQETVDLFAWMQKTGWDSNAVLTTNENGMVTPKTVPSGVAGSLGIDYVIEYVINLSGTNYVNGWYRKYKSGWVEQGGMYVATTPLHDMNVTIPLFITMANSNYTVQTTHTETAGMVLVSTKTYTTTSFNLIAYGFGTNDRFSLACWEVKGKGA